MTPVPAPIRLNIPVPPDLHRQAKVQAAREGTTLKALVADALQARLSRNQPQEVRQ